MHSLRTYRFPSQTTHTKRRIWGLQLKYKRVSTNSTVFSFDFLHILFKGDYGGGEGEEEVGVGGGGEGGCKMRSGGEQMPLQLQHD